jgi:hypothetical protein
MVGGVMGNLYQSQILGQIQRFKTSFQRLGADIQSGNVSSALQDFAELTNSSSSSQTSTAMQQLRSDLQSGNLPSAQQDYTAIQRALQQHRFEHSGSRQSSASSDTPNTFDPLGLLQHLAHTAFSCYTGAGVPGL